MHFPSVSMPVVPILRLVLIYADSAIEHIVLEEFGSPNNLRLLSFMDFESASSLETLAKAIQDSDAVLIEWDLMRAVAFGQVCTRVHDAHGFVIALVPPDDRASTALALGADTFHAQPLSAELLQAQILAHRRIWSALRIANEEDLSSKQSVISAGPVQLDLGTGELKTSIGPESEAVTLSMRQAKVMACFLRSPGQTLSREQLLTEAWGWDFDPGTNVVDVYVHYLRQVLGQFGLRSAIETVRGRGYRFTSAPQLLSPPTSGLLPEESQDVPPADAASDRAIKSGSNDHVVR